MFLLYLRRELGKRKRQTAVVASGLAIAIGLAAVVQSASAGVSDAQSNVLQSMYGIGTDIAITQTSAEEPMHQRFEIGGSTGETQDKSRTFSRSQLRKAPGVGTLTAAQVAKVQAVAGVAKVTGTLRLSSITFNGELPTFTLQQGDTTQQQGGNTQGQLAPMPTDGTANQTEQPAQGTQPQGGFDGRGGSAFDINSFSVEGFDPANTSVGPMTSMSLVSGRLLTSADASGNVALVDSAYAKSASLDLKSTITIADTKFSVVGIVQSTSSEGSTSSNVFIPLARAQKLSDNAGTVTNVYVSAESAADVSTVTAAIQTALPDATVNSSATLADSVTGSLATASNLVSNLGRWLSLVVLLAAFLIAMLLTASGVQRRTREFGTLKAIGWKSGRIVRQVVGESLVTGLIGGIAGIAIGAVGIWAVNAYAPALTAAPAATGFAARFQQFAGNMPGAPGGMPGGGRFGEALQSSATSVALHASLSPNIVLLALALALAGGALAGAFGGWRAARLRPAAALRSVA